MLRQSTPTAESIRQRLGELQGLWTQIREETEHRHTRLSQAHEAQQYYFDGAEAEAWMSEQELYMMSEEKAKVRGSHSICAVGNLRLMDSRLFPLHIFFFFVVNNNIDKH